MNFRLFIINMLEGLYMHGYLGGYRKGYKEGKKKGHQDGFEAGRRAFIKSLSDVVKPEQE